MHSKMTSKLFNMCALIASTSSIVVGGFNTLFNTLFNYLFCVDIQYKKQSQIQIFNQNIYTDFN